MVEYNVIDPNKNETQSEQKEDSNVRSQNENSVTDSNKYNKSMESFST